MAKKVIKMLVTTDNLETKILLDLKDNNLAIIKKLEDILNEEYTIEREELENEKTCEASLELGAAINKLAGAFTAKKEEIEMVCNSIYVAYLMMKDEISLDKIGKYANFSRCELEIIKYYLIEKLKF